MKQSIPMPVIAAVAVVLLVILGYFGLKAFNAKPGPSNQTQATIDHYKNLGKQPGGMMGPGGAAPGAAK